jgi:mRNA-degrading endonuclease RelE of RelBE toxin-antitoxin system
MAYTLEFEQAAIRSLKKLTPQVAEQLSKTSGSSASSPPTWLHQAQGQRQPLARSLR